MKSHRLLFAASLLLCSFTASAQSLLWNQSEVSWTLPTTCMNGTPISNCPLTGVIVETAPTEAGPWTQLSTEVANETRRLYSNLAEGPHCYRQISRSNAGNSDPSNVSCKTNVEPPPRPSPAVMHAIDTVAMSVRADWEQLAFVPNNAVGTIALGTQCDESKPLGDGWYAVALDAVTWTGRNRPANVVARCALN